jgi:hypothetical protein
MVLFSPNNDKLIQPLFPLYVKTENIIYVFSQSSKTIGNCNMIITSEPKPILLLNCYDWIILVEIGILRVNFLNKSNKLWLKMIENFENILKLKIKHSFIREDDCQKRE